MSSTAPLPLPQTFGRFTLFDFIGRGGMAEIYLARSPGGLGAERLDVVKLILPELAGSSLFAEMFITEAKLAAKLSHASIVQVHDLGREDDKLFIAMEYVEGFDLNQLLKRCSQKKVPLPVEFALHIVAETLRALDYAHRLSDEDGTPLGIVHRDVSPSNVLVSFEGEVKLCDFGIAHATDAVSSIDEAELPALQGKAGYMSPEHARGDTFDARADVYAAGILLWELLAGRRRYKANESQTLLDVAREARWVDLEPRGLANEAELFAIVRKAQRDDPTQRYQSAGAMLRDLEAYISKSGFSANALRLGAFLRDTFGDDIVEKRRARERASRNDDAGAVSAAPDSLPGVPAVGAQTQKVVIATDPIEPENKLLSLDEVKKRVAPVVVTPEADKKKKLSLTTVVIALVGVAVLIFGVLWPLFHVRAQ